MNESTIGSSEIAALRTELKCARDERALVNTQLLQIRTERDFARAEVQRMEQLIAAARLKSELADNLQIEMAALQQELDREKLRLATIEESRSWRLVLRIRRLISPLRGRR